MVSGSKYVRAIGIFITLVAAVCALTWAVFGKTGGLVLSLTFTASLIEWGINTLWARAVAKDKITVVVVVTGVNSFATMVMVALYDLIKVHNPDGTPFLVLGMLVYGLGGAAGAFLAMYTTKK